MTIYLTNSGGPLTREMASFLLTIQNHQCRSLSAGRREKEVFELAACAGISVARTWHYIEELGYEYLEEKQDHFVLTLKARSFLVDNNLDW